MPEHLESIAVGVFHLSPDLLDRELLADEFSLVPTIGLEDSGERDGQYAHCDEKHEPLSDSVSPVLLGFVFRHHFLPCPRF